MSEECAFAHVSKPWSPARSASSTAAPACEAASNPRHQSVKLGVSRSEAGDCALIARSWLVVTMNLCWFTVRCAPLPPVSG